MLIDISIHDFIHLRIAKRFEVDIIIHKFIEVNIVDDTKIQSEGSYYELKSKVLVSNINLVI